MRLRLVVHVVGLLVRGFSVTFVVPLLVDLWYGQLQDALGFLVGGLAALVLGEVARRQYRTGAEPRRLEGLTVVASAWLVVSFFAAIPYLWNGLGLVDSLFESMSGLTTTGATIFTDFSAYGRGLYLWRSMTQWFGGMGVIALFIAVLPKLAIAGRQLFFAEAPGPEEERLTPRIRHTAIALWALYVGLTAAEIAMLTAAGMQPFDAVCNAFTTMAAGGFSPHPQSIGGYDNAAAEWVIIGFMFLAGANYSLQYRALRGRPGALFRDQEFRTYALVVIVGTLLTSYALLPFARDPSPEYLVSETSLGVLDDAEPTTVLRQGAFQVLSIVTTTGYATDDFALWNDGARAMLLALMFLGGSAGSAAGGPKVVRILLVGKYAFVELFKVLHPQAVRPVRYNGRVVPGKVLRAIVSFLLLYLTVYVVGVLLLALMGVELITALTASIATLGNIGPGFGIVGPMGTYAGLPSAAKVLLFANMWIGRLEVMTVLVLLQPEVWKSARLEET